MPLRGCMPDACSWIYQRWRPRPRVCVFTLRFSSLLVFTSEANLIEAVELSMDVLRVGAGNFPPVLQFFGCLRMEPHKPIQPCRQSWRRCPAGQARRKQLANGPRSVAQSLSQIHSSDECMVAMQGRRNKAQQGQFLVHFNRTTVTKPRMAQFLKLPCARKQTTTNPQREAWSLSQIRNTQG